jgi:hypothetical protein
MTCGRLGRAPGVPLDPQPLATCGPVVRCPIHSGVRAQRDASTRRGPTSHHSSRPARRDRNVRRIGVAAASRRPRGLELVHDEDGLVVRPGRGQCAGYAGEELVAQLSEFCLASRLVPARSARRRSRRCGALVRSPRSALLLAARPKPSRVWPKLSSALPSRPTMVGPPAASPSMRRSWLRRPPGSESNAVWASAVAFLTWRSAVRASLASSFPSAAGPVPSIQALASSFALRPSCQWTGLAGLASRPHSSTERIGRSRRFTISEPGTARMVADSVLGRRSDMNRHGLTAGPAR